MNNNIGMETIIDELKRKSIEVWESTPDTFPLLYKKFAVYEHSVNEARFKAFIDDVVRLVKGFKGNGSDDTVQWGTSLKRLIYDCGVNIVGLSDDSMRLLLNEGFCDVTSEFITEARRFDASFRFDDILQSLRNVWIMDCIQRLMGKRIELTKSIFAYSMLYPYTDNFLDANQISNSKKNNTNNNLGKRLAGFPVTAGTPLENKLFRLVDIIEAQYDRSQYQMVYQSLSGIHDAQVGSMRQDGSDKLSTEEIFAISVEKGGSSVLADGCLIKGSLSEDEAEFIFNFGVLLQLIDDLQDIETDKSNGHNTLFSVNVGSDTIQSHTNRLINFTIALMDDDKCFTGKEAVQIKELMKKSIVILAMGAIASNTNLFDKNYLIALQEYSPIDFNSLKRSYKRIGREYGKLRLKFSVKSLEVPMAKAFASGILS